MITSIHTLIYSDDANATRAFLRDVLGWKYVAEDFDENWLIFTSGPSEMGVHPTHSEWEGQTYDHPRHHSIALMCDDIETTVEELRAKGAQFRGPIEQTEYGRVIMLIDPGADDIQLYQPTHKLAYHFGCWIIYSEFQAVSLSQCSNSIRFGTRCVKIRGSKH